MVPGNILISNDIQTSITYRYERLRAISIGILETSAVTFLLLIAVRYFNCGPTSKAILAASTSVGFVLSPFVVHLVARYGAKVTSAATFLGIISAFGYLIGSVFESSAVFIFGGVLGVAANSMAIPIVTQVYQENYPASMRGKLYARTVMIRIGTAAVFSELAGRALTGRIEFYRPLIFLFSLSAAFGAYCLSRIPSQAIRYDESSGVFSSLGFIKSDRVLRQTLISWMLMGFANLMMLPLRVEYVANPRYGLNLSVSEIALLTGVIPNLARFMLAPVWGSLFDRVNFFALRIIVNIGFMVGIISFFTSTTITGLVCGALLFGVANAGGDIAWSLWITKFAPAERVASYMAIHSFFTGVRGLVAPFAAFYLIEGISPEMMGIISASLIGVACIILIPEYRVERCRLSGTGA